MESSFGPDLKLLVMSCSCGVQLKLEGCTVAASVQWSLRRKMKGHSLIVIVTGTFRACWLFAARCRTAHFHFPILIYLHLQSNHLQFTVTAYIASYYFVLVSSSSANCLHHRTWCASRAPFPVKTQRFTAACKTQKHLTLK